MGDRKNCCAIAYSEQCLRHSRDKGVKICREGLSRAEERMMIEGLRVLVRGLIADYNRAVGDAVLYFTECLGIWVLFARQNDGSDKRVATGFATVESLSALVEIMEKEILK